MVSTVNGHNVKYLTLSDLHRGMEVTLEELDKILDTRVLLEDFVDMPGTHERGKGIILSFGDSCVIDLHDKNNGNRYVCYNTYSDDMEADF